MIERILVPLDGSRVGEAALPLVEELVSKLGPTTKVKVTLFQAITSTSHWVIAGEASARIPYTEKEFELIQRDAKKYLNKIGERLRSLGATVKTKTSVGDAAGEILKTADETNANLIAMSTHGRSGLSRWAFGSVTEKVLREGLTPILTVRAPKDTVND